MNAERVALQRYPGIEVTAAPAPWTLSGRGWIVLYHPNRKTRSTLGFGGADTRGLSALMMVDYSSSPAGPYKELLWIPGKRVTPFGPWYHISRILVSSMESVINGRINWEIPKERADFSFHKSGDIESVAVSDEQGSIFEASFRARGPVFPVSTALLPFPLLQEAEPGSATPAGTTGTRSRWLQTTFSGSGRGRFARMTDCKIHPERFPALAKLKPLAVLAVEPFNIKFPEAKEYT